MQPKGNLSFSIFLILMLAGLAISAPAKKIDYDQIESESQQEETQDEFCTVLKGQLESRSNIQFQQPINEEEGQNILEFTYHLVCINYEKAIEAALQGKYKGVVKSKGSKESKE